MIYFLTHLGGNFPSHIEHCIRQINKKDTNSEIYICGDVCPTYIKGRYTYINSKDLDISLDDNYMANESDPLWRTSLMRIFAVNSFMQKENIEGIIHFDNDVMIYGDFTDLQHNFNKKNYITPHKHTEYAFGFSYLNNKDDFNTLTEKIKEIIKEGDYNVRRLTGDESHEMRLLSFCGTGLIEPLPVHPELGNTNNFIFDPSSYGQFIGGTPNGHSSGFIDNTQLVGSYFKTLPEIYYNKEEDIYHYHYCDKVYKIFNLHIHSKKLKDFYHET